MKIGIASDHAGYDQKERIKKYLKNYEVVDFGTDNATISVDYPDYAHKLCNAVNNKQVDLGIAICKTGIGMSIACNKVKGIRCAKPCNAKEMKLSRLDNDSNVVAFSADMPMFKVKSILKEFFNTEFSNAERHIRRIGKLDEY